MSAATDRFAAAAARCTASVFARLANASAEALDGNNLPIAFDVVFDAPAAQAGFVADIGPQALCQTADVAAVAWGSGITIAGTDYTVSAIQPDGTGVTTLQLREA